MSSFQSSPTQLHPDHLLSFVRPSPSVKKPQYEFSQVAIDTSTLAAHDFDVDVRSGFLPPEPPVARLPGSWETWEIILDDAIQNHLTIGGKIDITPSEIQQNTLWRNRVQSMPFVDIGRLTHSERLLRRAHLVLAWILHFYIHSHPVEVTSIVIPTPLTKPLLLVSQELAIPPVLTYADTVLYNWKYKDEASTELSCVTLFTGTQDEEHFFLTSAYIELAGVEALSLMRKCFDEIFVADELALKRITSYLKRLVAVIKKLTTILNDVKQRCDPKVFYNDVRPWFSGEDSGRRPWIFLDENGEEINFGERRELSGPSAGQSTLIHALDVFLGVEHPSPHKPTTSSTTKSAPRGFLERMQSYMPRHHRGFINHLKTLPRSLRALVEANSTLDSGASSPISIAYDGVILALKGFRDAHIQIATLYIINQIPRSEKVLAAPPDAASQAKGTGGTDLIPFLKGSRDDTKRTLLREPTQL